MGRRDVREKRREGAIWLLGGQGVKGDTWEGCGRCLTRLSQRVRGDQDEGGAPRSKWRRPSVEQEVLGQEEALLGRRGDPQSKTRRFSVEEEAFRGQKEKVLGKTEAFLGQRRRPSGKKEETLVLGEGGGGLTGGLGRETRGQKLVVCACV